MRTPLTVAAVAATGLLLVGGGAALALGQGGAPAEVTAVPAASSVSSTGSAAPTGDLLPPELPRTAVPAAPAVDRAAAERAALAAAGGGRVTDVEFDAADRDDDGDDRDRDHWEVEVTNGTTEHDIDLDAATGRILDHDIDRDDTDERDDTDDRDDD